jgi:predicted RNA binding protein YcfA (HicA-like mRNA interferase family)
MPPKIRELIADLEAAGFVNRGGKGSHRNYEHKQKSIKLTVSGKAGVDAKPYQERLVKKAIREAKS